jgi:hypothetical protein
MPIVLHLHQRPLIWVVVVWGPDALKSPRVTGDVKPRASSALSWRNHTSNNEGELWMDIQDRDYARDAGHFGFRTIGVYADGVFTIERPARSDGAVYVWMLGAYGLAIPVRVGETRRLGSRFSSYNSWLGGRQWPGERRNAREHEKARLTKLRLGSYAEVIAVPVPDKDAGLAVERALLELWEPVLDLNFELHRSWGRARVREWSTNYDIARSRRC